MFILCAICNSYRILILTNQCYLFKQPAYFCEKFHFTISICIDMSFSISIQLICIDTSISSISMTALVKND